MRQAHKIHENIYLVGGPGISDDTDCNVYLIDCSSEMVLIDAGAGKSVNKMRDNIAELGLTFENISLLVCTHAHIDHVGGISRIRELTGARVAAHIKDADALEKADNTRTAALWYGMKLPAIMVDEHLEGEFGTWLLGGHVLNWLHTPGHTPGSISLYIDVGGQRILFGQDIHGPFLPEFKSNIRQWHSSMQILVNLQADILCEGHFGIYKGKEEVISFLESNIRRYIG
jgi:glyoxylase-like metal-dependent hydrolase (beta-lactamase superfamily II)